MLNGKHIVLGITGGIAAYKSVVLLRLLVKNGAEVQVVMTPNACEFVRPLTFSTLSGKPVITQFFSANSGEWHSHVDLGIWADLFVIAPATASTIGKMANGIADNMLVTTYLSAKEDVMIAPAMDLDMWRHPSTQRNIDCLKKDGVIVIQPDAGELASGLSGKGRMAEPEIILREIKEYFRRKETLKGIKALVTAGPTYEKLDPVRFIGNYSSGKMGFEIADELHRRGAEVTLISGPVSVKPYSDEINLIGVESAREMYREALKCFPDADLAVFAAAVADYAPEKISELKIKRENEEELEIKLVRNPDIAAELGKRKTSRQITVGFALETHNEKENALKKLKSKNLDWIVLNSLQDPEAGFMKETNKVTIWNKENSKFPFEAKSKREVASDIIDVISQSLEKSGSIVG
ncbi:MAG: bifunctional phosphopantothenoylcysteine decarboxylase/phosphopantothenate--cysteine ligase CoaBC [Muribaculaceae bacterium]|nr:bifunctional phosphopantothenoylcysteine decarboxylase/phosphopantothenate--cysteine ligase CoaBC [Muribaculaceae bacterium]